MKSWILHVLLCTLMYNSYCQDVPVKEQNYAVEELKSDFNIFRAALEEAHPGLYRYNSRNTMDSIFSSYEASIQKPMTEREFRILLSKMVSNIGCGHTRVVAPKPEQDKLDAGATAIPFQLYWDRGNLYVQRNYSPLSDAELLGAKIVSINNHSAAEFMSDFQRVFPSDGRITTNKQRMLSRSRLLTRYFSYLYGYRESYEIEYIPQHETAIRKTTLQGLIFDDLLDISNKRYPAPPLVEFKLLSEIKTAYLRVASFDKTPLEENKINFSKFLKNAFQTIAANRVDNLILDLRNNGGGTDEYGKLLFSYLMDREFQYYSALRMKKESFDFFKYTNRPNARAPKGMLKANSQGSFDNIQHPNAGIQKPSAPSFSGKLYVLINGFCFSTTAECLSMIHSYTNSTFIGEEGGSGYYGNNSGPTPDLILPVTKVRIEIPLMEYHMAVKDYTFKDRGLIPDHEVIPTIQDRISGNDPELEYALQLIKNP